MRKRYVAGHRLGRLEAEVMEFIWSQEQPVGVNEILAALRGRKRAYTTVMTIVTRLYEKGLVERERRGRAFVYRPAGSKEEVAARALLSVLGSTENPEAVLAYFIEDLRTSPELVERLQDLTRKGRRR